MAEILAFGVEKLWDLLIRESERFQGVQEQFDVLKREVTFLTSFLKDTYAKRYTSVTLMTNIQEIKEIVYDAEDIIENFLYNEELENTSSTMKRVRRFSCGFVESREISFDIERISKRISTVIRDLQVLKVQQEPAREREIRPTFPTENVSDLVGLEKNITRLVGYLKEEDCSQVVSIIGMGGLGKTTLAKEVFNHEIVKEQFEGRAWICFPQHVTMKPVWQAILQQLRKDYKVSKMEVNELQEKLSKVLQTQKTLIVLDDIWKEENWNEIKQMFPRKGGWKVLLTSRNESVALHVDPRCFIFKPDFLNLEESWMLFQSQAFPTITQNYEEKEKVGKEITKNCGGLPLAIRVLGGMLAEKNRLDEWKRVSNDIISYLMRKKNRNDDDDNNNIDSFNYILSLSFEELPSYLKYCFLYLAHFPEDHQISVEELSYYWAADGIIKRSHLDGEPIKDNGHSYIEELVRRNMVISERNSGSLRFETCHLHDMMREVCLYKAKEDNFLQIHGILNQTTNTQSRRYVLQNTEQFNVKKDAINPKLRSLMIVEDKFGKSCSLSGLKFTMVPILRVLDLKFIVTGDKLPKNIGKLIYLRYLSLKGAHVRHLTSSLGKLKLLLYLNINVNTIVGPIFVPNVLMGMQELRYLALPYDMDEKTKLNLSNQVNLETLINFSTENSSLEDIHGMTRLRYLTMKLKLTRKASLETLYAVVAELRQLETFDIECNESTDPKYETIVEKGFFSNLVQLKYLRLNNMYMKRLVSENYFPSHLTYLSLSHCHLEEDPMPIIEKLLHLIEVNLLYEAFDGKTMVCSSRGFPQLQKLSFVGLEEWEEWIVEEGSMPLLHTLEISYCRKLKELPHGLSFSSFLKDLTLHEFGEEWKEKLSEDGEDNYKIKHIPSVTFSSDN